MKSKDEVFEAIDKYNVRFVRIWFTDILGVPKSFAINPNELEGAFSEGMGFDGSSIEGFARIHESDMVAKPDPTTFQLIPWRQQENAVARMFCDIQNPDGTPYEGDPRYVLKRNLERIKDKGYSFLVGPELEFFYFKGENNTEVLDHGGYFDLTTADNASDLRRDTILALDSMGIDVEYSHHEVAPSQHEIDLRYKDALNMADTVMTYKITVKEIARRYGYHASFMPKPIFGQNGSGMHVHQSLFQGKRNVMFDAGDAFHLSSEGKYYIAGLLKHAPEITAITNQWINSYKRTRLPSISAGPEGTDQLWSECPCTSRETRPQRESNSAAPIQQPIRTWPSQSCWPQALPVSPTSTSCPHLRNRTSTT
jgi:glutamine synthetase